MTFPISLESIVYLWDQVVDEANTLVKKRGKGFKHKLPSRALCHVLAYFPSENMTIAIHALRGIARFEEHFSDIVKFIYRANKESYGGSSCTRHDFEMLLSTYKEWEVASKIFKDWVNSDVSIHDGHLTYNNPQISFMSHICLERASQNKSGLIRHCDEKVNAGCRYPLSIKGTPYTARNHRELYSLCDAALHFISEDLALRIESRELGQWMMLFFDFREALLKRYDRHSFASKSCPRISVEYLVKTLSEIGHDTNFVRKFLSLIQFNPMKSRDLFDGLLIDDRNDHHEMLFIRAYVDHVDVVPALASILNHASIDSSERGILFEKTVKKKLADNGITAERLHRKNPLLGEFELDLSFRLDDKYYFIQCKASSPVYTMSREKFFKHIVEFYDQARRVSDYFKTQIGLIPELTSAVPARYHKTYIVVSFLMPFVVSFPEDDLLIIDWTTLGRFLDRNCPKVSIKGKGFPDKTVATYFKGPITSDKLDSYIELNYPLRETWKLAEFGTSTICIEDRTIEVLGISTIGGFPMNMNDIAPEFFRTQLSSMGYTNEEIDEAVRAKL